MSSALLILCIVGFFLSRLQNALPAPVSGIFARLEATCPAAGRQPLIGINGCGINRALSWQIDTMWRAQLAEEWGEIGGSDRRMKSARRRRLSRLHSLLLLLAMAALLAYCGWIVADWQGMLWSLVASSVVLLTLRRMPTGFFLRTLNARALALRQTPALYQILCELCRVAGLTSFPMLYQVPGPVPLAFTVGGADKAAIVLSTPLLQAMSRREMRGILAHEIVHLRNGDLALMQLAVAVGRLTRVVSQVALMLVFVGLMLRVFSAAALPIAPLMILAAAPLGVSLLQAALSRARETEADLEAAELTRDPLGLASALIKMRRQEQMLLQKPYPHMIRLPMPSILRDHPATEERIRQLLAMSPPEELGPAEKTPNQSVRHGPDPRG